MEVKRLFDIFPYQQEKYPKGDALGGKFGNVWETFSSQQIIELTDTIALGLLKLGLQQGDKAAIIANNCVEWTFADQSILKMGGVVIPIYTTIPDEIVAYTLNHAEVKLIFAQNEELYEKILRIKDQVPTLQHVYTFEEVKGAETYKSMTVPATDEGRKQLKEIQDKVKPNDLATIIYTSGTTGLPKGVMLSHNNLISNILSSVERLPVNFQHTALSFLPLSHIFERMITYMYFFVGVSVYYGEGIDKIGDNLKEIRPHVFTAVPRLLEKVYDKVQAGGLAGGGVKKSIFQWATKIALAWKPDGANGGGYKFKHSIADRLVFSKIRAKAGLDRVLAVASGSAKLQARLARYFNALGVPLVEGYGLTETSPVISVNGFEKGMMKIGTVGRVISGGDVKIYSDGEICYKGPNLMMGYYKNETKTNEVIDEHGYFHTGDIGEIDAQGFLKITDRKKSMWKTSGGKYIAPQPIENKFKESIFIEQCVVVGEGEKFPGALIVPNFEHLYIWLEEENIKVNHDMPAAVITMDIVKKKFMEEVDRMNDGFGKWEKIKRFELLDKEMTVESGELTPTLKPKRKVIRENYSSEIARIYDI